MIVIFLPNLSEKYPFIIDPSAAPNIVIETISYLSESVIAGKDYFRNNNAPEITVLIIFFFENVNIIF